jgi:hypothetical protein
MHIQALYYPTVPVRWTVICIIVCALSLAYIVLLTVRDLQHKDGDYDTKPK